MNICGEKKIPKDKISQNVYPFYEKGNEHCENRSIPCTELK